MISCNATLWRLARLRLTRYHRKVDTTTFFIPLILVQQLTWTPPSIQYACAQTYDPPACYDEWQATRNPEDAIMMGNWKRPTHTTSSFYQYIDPTPLPSTKSFACTDENPAIKFCY